MRLFNFWRSGTSHRLRIVLGLKGLSTEYVPIHLGKEEHLGESYKAINPQMLVPALDIGERVLVQSPAIIEWLEETCPEPPLLPQDPQDRAEVRALAALIGCDVHPVNNRRILEYLRQHFDADERAVHDWCGTWITAGFDAYEEKLKLSFQRGKYSFGNKPTIADAYLIPQVEGARRFNVDLSLWPRILEVENACLELAAFRSASPAMQVDAV